MGVLCSHTRRASVLSGQAITLVLKGLALPRGISNT